MDRMIVSFLWYEKFSIGGLKSKNDFEIIVFIEKSEVITFEQKT